MAKATWNEADHPRDALGKFTSKSSGSFGVLIALFILGALIAPGNGAGAPESAPRHWQANGLTFARKQQDIQHHCAAHSYGQTHSYLAIHPCTGLNRVLYDVTDATGVSMIVSTATVTMLGAAQARQLRELIDRPGTGNISELGATEFTGRYYASRQNGSTVTIAQAEPRDGTADQASLDEAADSALNAPLP